jgi:hypothetical protein
MNSNHNNSINRYLIGILQQHVRKISSDISDKIYNLENIRATLNNKGQFGAGPRSQEVKDQAQRIKDHIKDILLESGKTEEIVDGFVDKLNNFKKDFDTVIDDVDELDTLSKKNTFDINSLTNAKKKYDAFLTKLAEYKVKKIDSKETYQLLQLKDSSNQSAYFKDNKDLDFGTFYQLYKPFVVNFELLKSTFEKGHDVVPVFTQIEHQTNINISSIKAVEQLLSGIEKRLDILDVKLTLPLYVMMEILENNFFKYRIGDNEKEYTIAINNKNSDNMGVGDEDYMTTIQLDSLANSDSLNAIRGDSISAIKSYLELLKGNVKYERDDIGNIDGLGIDLNELTILGHKLDGHPKPHSQRAGSGKYTYEDDELLLNHALYHRMYDFISEISKINKKLANTQIMVDTVLMHRERMQMYMMYIAQAGMMNGVEKIRIYRYIDKSTLERYLLIINEIFEKIDSIPMGPKLIDSIDLTDKRFTRHASEEYFRSYHMYMLQRMHNFLKALVLAPAFNDDHIIDITNSNGPITDDFVLFNHFKDILDNYRESTQT